MTDDDWSGPICNAEPLKPDNDALFRSLWRWLSERANSRKPAPQVTGGTDLPFYHDGLIGIDERHRDAAFPLGAVMLEELLHYVLTSDDPATSAEFSPAFLRRILDLIVAELRDRPEHPDKRAFQSVLIRELWRAYCRSEGVPSALSADARTGPGHD